MDVQCALQFRFSCEYAANIILFVTGLAYSILVLLSSVISKEENGFKAR